MITINNIPVEIVNEEQIHALHNNELIIISDLFNDKWKPYVDFIKVFNKEYPKYEEYSKDKMKYIKPVVQIHCKNAIVTHLSTIIKGYEIIDNPKIDPDFRKQYPIDDPYLRDVAIHDIKEEKLIKLIYHLGNPSMITYKERKEDSNIIFEAIKPSEYEMVTLPKYKYKFIGRINPI